MRPRKGEGTVEENKKTTTDINRSLEAIKLIMVRSNYFGVMEKEGMDNEKEVEARVVQAKAKTRRFNEEVEANGIRMNEKDKSNNWEWNLEKQRADGEDIYGIW